MNDEIKRPEELRHLAIIMDGNGRWAGQRGLSRSEGHKAGTEAAKEVVSSSRKMGLKYLTLYAFSKENWRRPEKEVKFLFDLLLSFLKQEQKKLVEQSIKLNVLGDWQELPLIVRQGVKNVLSLTKDCKEMTLNLALNYSARDEILMACRSLIRQGLDQAEVTEEKLKEHLFTRDQPDPDLIIRTSGELRLSNYLLFQAAYSELYFTPVLWPDFDEKELKRAFEEFSRRKRRFGGID